MAKKYRNKVIQTKYIDDSEGEAVQEFIWGVIKKYQLKKYYPQVETRYRGVLYDMRDDMNRNLIHHTDDKLIQIVCQNKLIALVFCRRDDWNYTEATMVFVGDALTRVEEIEEKIANDHKRRFENNEDL